MCLDSKFSWCLPVGKQQMLPGSKRDVEASIACVRAVLQTDHVIHLLAMLIHDLVRGPASQHFSFLEEEENIWSKRCYPKVLADGKASERARERERERESASCASSLETTVFDEEGEESLTHCCRHTHTHRPLEREEPCLQAPPNECSLFASVFTVAGRLFWFPCHFDLSYTTPCLGIGAARCNCPAAVSRLRKPVFSTWD